MPSSAAPSRQDMGVIAFGKLESGEMRKGAKALIMPDRRPVIIETILHQDREVDHAVSGDNVKIKLKGAEEDVSPIVARLTPGSQARLRAVRFQVAVPRRCVPSPPC